MPELNDLHDQAMEIADDADIARRKGKLEEAQALYRQAYELELQVAQQVTVEPSRSVMYRSAASLALECGLLDEAQTLAQSGLAGQPPIEILEELQEIIIDIELRRRQNTVQPRITHEQRKIDFAAEPATVRSVAEAVRLAFGHLFNPAFATEISAIEPLPHQRIAVYDRMLPQARLRFLLADDAGAGKTIMSGLYIREMLSRRLIHRVLIVPPAGLVGNWYREMEKLFNLPFRIISGKDSRRINPFAQPDSDLAIVSVDTLSSNRVFERLKEGATPPYDLVIFDESHKLSANRDPDFTVRKTDRYKLAEALIGISSNGMSLDWNCRHLLLLSATPHMGRDYPYYALWRLLEPEILSTPEAFEAYPPAARQRHFIRRTKEEMVRFDGTPIYPKRVTDTLSYDLTQGEISEQRLYDETTDYIRFYYNRARILNRSAARLAMSVFQRRLASSTYALMQSLDRRVKKLTSLIEDVEAGRIDLTTLSQREPDYALETKTADEEDVTDEGLERSQADEERVLSGVVAVSLAELVAERLRVKDLLDLAIQVDNKGDESKLQRLLIDVIRNPAYRDEKLIIFTEHRDTLDFIVRRLEGMGFTGEIARLHGGMDYPERDQQVELFRKPFSEGGAKYLVATDAAGEGINLQFCWLMVNYDIPWNPARLEQRMGRIHRYGQLHDPVIIINLVAGKTREGRVLKTLLDKLERIRKELGSDKVFDVVGRLFEGVSIREYMERVLADSEAAAELEIDQRITKQHVQQVEQQERTLYGDTGDVRKQLPEVQAKRERSEKLRLLPGYVRRFVEEAAPQVGLEVEGNLDTGFTFQAAQLGALNPLTPIMERYPEDARGIFATRPPNGTKSDITPIVLRPGEPIFERFRTHVIETLGDEARRGGVFVDPTASQPYIFHLAHVRVVRRANVDLRPLNREEVIETRLVGLRQSLTGEMSEYPVEALLLLRGGQHSANTLPYVVHGGEFLARAQAYLVDHVGASLVAQHRSDLEGTILEREDFIRKGFQFEESELATARTRLREKSKTGGKATQRELDAIRERQQRLAQRRDTALRVLRREPELLALDEVEFITHALVMPSADPEDRRRYDEAVEAVAMHEARVYEEARGAQVYDVSTPEGARAAGLLDHPGFDLLSVYPNGDTRSIEVKGRANIGDVELSENEWAKACNLRADYWLYVVYNCATATPQLERVRDPFYNLLVRPRGGVIVDETQVLGAAERE